MTAGAGLAAGECGCVDRFRQGNLAGRQLPGHAANADEQRDCSGCKDNRFSRDHFSIPAIDFHVRFLNFTIGGLSNSTTVSAFVLQPATERKILTWPSV